MTKIKTIAILGTGFGGLRAAKILARNIHNFNFSSKYEILLIDKNSHQTYTPLLYEVATTSKGAASLCDLHGIATYNIKNLLTRSCVRFVQKEIADIDPASGTITFTDGERAMCEYIVLALGSEANFFNIPGLREHALPLKTFTDAIKIRDAFWNIAMEKPGEIRIVIGGGGSTGVELAAEFKNLCGQIETEFEGCKLIVTVVESSDSVLQGFDNRIVEAATRQLKKLGVIITTGKKISSVDRNRAAFDNGGTIDFDVFVWTGGVKGPAILANTQIQLENQNRAIVGSGMECLSRNSNSTFASRVYGLGDNICFYNSKTKRPVPGIARAVISQADIVAWNITEEIRAAEHANHRPRFREYKPVEYPYVIPVGGKFAVAKIGPIILKGVSGWIFKGLVELSYLLSIMPTLEALRIWFKGLSIFMRNEKLG
ncbi:MAG: FAD-dependent oxidoreductase [Patescibacteria group bacterium]